MKLTQRRLKEILNYNPRTGVFTWKIYKGSRTRRGGVSGTICSSTGYRRIKVDYAQYFGHRLAFLYMTGRIPKFVDHKNLKRSDNRWSNLRPATKGQNTANSKTRALSGLKGVCRDKRWSLKKPWGAQISIGGKTVRLGNFETKSEAAAAYKKAAAKLFGDFARFK